MKRFRVKQRDTVTAKAYGRENKLLATLYDGGYTTIGQVQSALLKLIPHHEGGEIAITIVNNSEETYKSYKIKTNN